MSRDLSGTRYLVVIPVVDLAVNFMGVVSVGGRENLLDFSKGIGLPIVALGNISGIKGLLHQIKQRNSFYRIKTNRLQRGRSSSNNWE